MEELKFKKITIEDKSLFDKYFCQYPPCISEYTFTNLFIWRRSREIEYCEYDNGLIILAGNNNEKYFLSPVGYSDFKKIINILIEYGNKFKITNKIKKITEEQLKSLDNPGITGVEDRDNFDYVYNTDDLAFLKGRKYSNKRGFVKKFFAEYYHKYWRYTIHCKDKCFELAEKWLSTRDSSDNSIIDEFNAIKELLDNYEKLDSVGGVLCVDEHITAFSFGEKLNKNTFVIHFEKGDSQYSGVYQTINKLFIENEIGLKYKYVNREQDLGIPGIRKAKLSYYPVKLIKKFNINF